MIFSSRPFCRDVRIEGNTYADGVLGKNIRTEHMKPDDVKIGDKEITK